MNIPHELIKFIEEETSNVKHTLLLSDAKEISSKYRSKDYSNKSIVSKESEVLAYAASRMPATYAAISCIIESTKHLLTNQPKSLIDIGAGTGAATFALSSYFNFEEITCYEKEKTMINIGKKLIDNYFKDEIKIRWEEFDLLKDRIDTKADLVIASYVLNEFDNEKKIRIIDKLYEVSNDLLLIVDPGTPTDYKDMMIVRDYLISKGANIIAPCPHQNECPLNKNNWCHFSTRLERSKLHRQLKEGQVPYEDEKYTYLLFSKNNHLKSLNRVLRHPFMRSNLVSLELCTLEGYKKVTYTKKDKEIYKKSRKIKVGEEI